MFVESETYLRPLRTAYGTAEKSEANYEAALDTLKAAESALTNDRRVAAYSAALHGIGALYKGVAWEQYTRVTNALKDLQALYTQGFADASAAEELELRLVYASFGKGLPPVFLADTWVRVEAKHLLRLLEDNGSEVPADLSALACTFLRTKLRLRFQDADRLSAIEAALTS